MRFDPNKRCGRDGCKSQAVMGDDFCSTLCAKEAYGTLEENNLMSRADYQRTRSHTRKGYVTVENTDAMLRLLDGSAGSGGPRKSRKKWKG